MRDLRYMHQMALLASILELSQTRQMCLWWSEFPLYVYTSHLGVAPAPFLSTKFLPASFFKLAVQYDFVAYGIMAKSAKRLAVVTRSTEALQDAARYQSLVLQGLNKAIHSFSKENADAVLCASISLQYHAIDG